MMGVVAKTRQCGCGGSRFPSAGILTLTAPGSRLHTHLSPEARSQLTALSCPLTETCASFSVYFLLSWGRKLFGLNFQVQVHHGGKPGQELRAKEGTREESHSHCLVPSHRQPRSTGTDQWGRAEPPTSVTNQGNGRWICPWPSVMVATSQLSFLLLR